MLLTLSCVIWTNRTNTHCYWCAALKYMTSSLASIQHSDVQNYTQTVVSVAYCWTTNVKLLHNMFCICTAVNLTVSLHRKLQSVQWRRQDFIFGRGAYRGAEGERLRGEWGAVRGCQPLPRKFLIIYSWNGTFRCTPQVFWRTYFKVLLCSVK